MHGRPLPLKFRHACSIRRAASRVELIGFRLHFYSNIEPRLNSGSIPLKFAWCYFANKHKQGESGQPLPFMVR